MINLLGQANAHIPLPFLFTPWPGWLPQILGGYEQVVRLAALLRLESICEALVSGLAAAAGLAAPAPHSSAGEAKQVAALSKLVSLGSCSEAGMLGSSWLVLLRALSQLERLQATLLPGSKGGLPPLPEGAAAMMASSSLDAAAAAAAEAAAQPAAAPPPPPSGSGFGRLLQRMGLSGGSGSSSESTGRSGGVVAGGPHGGLLAIKDEPGAGHVLWAETAGERGKDCWKGLQPHSAHCNQPGIVQVWRGCMVSV